MRELSQIWGSTIYKISHCRSDGGSNANETDILMDGDFFSLFLRMWDMTCCNLKTPVPSLRGGDMTVLQVQCDFCL